MTTIMITRAFGLTTLIFSIGFLFHLHHYEKMARKMVGEPTGFILGGVLPVLVGSLVINYDFGEALGWSSALLIVGWILFLVGVFRVLCVHWWVRIINRHIKYVPVMFAVLGLIFGLLLCFAGYIAPLYR